MAQEYHGKTLEQIFTAESITAPVEGATIEETKQNIKDAMSALVKKIEDTYEMTPAGSPALSVFTTMGPVVKLYDTTLNRYIYAPKSSLITDGPVGHSGKATLTGFTLHPQRTGSITVGSSMGFTLTDATPAAASIGAYTLDVSDTALATVSGNKITAKAIGDVDITATETASGVKETYSLHISANPATVVTSFTATAPKVALLVGATATASVGTAVPATAHIGKVQWASSDAKIIAVDANTGKYTAKSAGSAHLTATSGSVHADTAAITVTAPPPTLTGFTVGAESVAVGATVTMSATALPAGASAGTIVWSSATPANATVDSSTGVVTGVLAGTSVITATSGGKVGHGTVTVTAP